MTDRCDLCEKPIVAGEPRFGGTGDGGKSGARFGSSRHWRCQVDKFGRPGSGGLIGTKSPGPPIGLTPAKGPVALRERVRKPKVLRGPYNLSPNAAREWRPTGAVRSAVGKRRIEIECPFCFATFWAYVWSLAGGGKRCENCGALHGSTGIASPIEGNEELD